MKSLNKLILPVILILSAGLNAQENLSFKDKAVNLKNFAFDAAEIKKEQLSEFVKNNKQIQATLKFAKNHKKKLIVSGIFAANYFYGFCKLRYFRNVHCCKKAPNGYMLYMDAINFDVLDFPRKLTVPMIMLIHDIYYVLNGSCCDELCRRLL